MDLEKKSEPVKEKKEPVLEDTYTVELKNSPGYMSLINDVTDFGDGRLCSTNLFINLSSIKPLKLITILQKKSL